MSQLPLSVDAFRTLCQRLLASPDAVPADWAPTATTYDIPRFRGEADFVADFFVAARRILDEGAEPRSALAAAGIPYDYARLGTPWSSVYELYLQALTGASRVVSFASRTKPFLAPLEVPGRSLPARVFCRGELPLSPETRDRWSRRGVAFHEGFTGALPEAEEGVLTLFVADTRPEDTPLHDLPVDAVACPVTDGGVLLIRNQARFDAKALQLIRKRTVAALIAASAKAELAALVGVELPPMPSATVEEADEALGKAFPSFHSGAYFCTGLAAEAAVFTAAAQAVGGGQPVPLYYAENGYGGTGQLLFDILSVDRVIDARPLPVLGEGGHTLVDAVIERLSGTSGPAVIFVETPTNPQMQLHDFERLASALRSYEERTGHRVPVLVDTTMAPMYPLFDMGFAQGWPYLIVKSGSKYITRGKATLGLVLAGTDALSQQILAGTHALGREADSFAKPYQLRKLVDGVSDLPTRMPTISSHTLHLAARIREELAMRGHDDLTLYTMTPDQLEQGLHSGVLSFYLPAAPTSWPDLCDEFVAFLLEHASGLVKNRVSYGQSTGGGRPDPFYVINPEESTQGALSAEVKEAQKRGGVQICRISVPQHADIDALVEVMRAFFDRTYGRPG
jgi:cystathionine beta-lyase/cystathionine gamma-synthase